MRSGTGWPPDSVAGKDREAILMQWWLPRIGGLLALLEGLPARVVHHTRIFGAYDNIIKRRPALGRLLRGTLQTLEKTPLRFFGLSHLLIIEKKEA